MTEILLNNGDIIISDSQLDEMTATLAEAKRKGLMLNIFDTFLKKRVAFFAEAVSCIKEKKVD